MIQVRKRLFPLLAVLAIAAAGMTALVVPVANAIGNWEGNNPAYTWTTGNGVYYGYSWEWATVDSGPYHICVSPVRYEGGKFVFPYGWQCNSGREVFFSHGFEYAAHGVYNPNGSRQYFNEAFE